MKLEDLIKEHTEINLTIKPNDLLEFGEYIATNAVQKFIENHEDKIYSRSEVLKKFKICSTSLWRLEKMGLLQSRKIGRRSFYPESEIKRLLSLQEK